MENGKLTYSEAMSMQRPGKRYVALNKLLSLRYCAYIVLLLWELEGEDTKRVPLMWRYRQQHRICEHCSADQSVHTHHIIPISKGGADDDSNYAALCLLCHADEHPEIKNFILNGDYVPAGLSA